MAVDASDPKGFVVQKLGDTLDNTSPCQQGPLCGMGERISVAAAENASLNGLAA